MLIIYIKTKFKAYLLARILKSNMTFVKNTCGLTCYILFDVRYFTKNMIIVPEF